MCRPLPRRHRTHAFTFVEILIVLTIIAIAMSLFATYANRPDTATRLSSARQMTWAKLREARGVAAMRQSPARLLIHMDPSHPELMYKSVMIVAETEIGSDQWEAVHDTDVLPRGVCWVPPAGVAGWTGPCSSGGKAITLGTAIAGWKSGTACWAYEFHSSGRITSSRYDLCLAQGSTEGGAPIFYNPSNYRAVRVSAYGQVSELADSTLPK
jgi:prepilin-type N-terminal cleavage/methylation domain-containing protein